MLNWLEVDEVVAIGHWVTNDPNAMVHCVALGKNASRVWVDEMKNPSAELWKKYADIGNNRRCFGKFNCMANRSNY